LSAKLFETAARLLPATHKLRPVLVRAAAGDAEAARIARRELNRLPVEHKWALARLTAEAVEADA
jgi:hypothetical protein